MRGVRGWLELRGGTVSPQSFTEQQQQQQRRQRGQCVWPGRASAAPPPPLPHPGLTPRPSPSLTLSLSVPRSCFSLGPLFALAAAHPPLSGGLAPLTPRVCARARERAHNPKPACLGSGQVPLTRSSKRRGISRTHRRVCARPADAPPLTPPLTMPTPHLTTPPPPPPSRLTPGVHPLSTEAC